MPVPSLASLIGPALVALGLAALLAVLIHRNLQARVGKRSPGGDPVFPGYHTPTPQGRARTGLLPTTVQTPAAAGAAATPEDLQAEVLALRAEVEILTAALGRSRPGRRRRRTAVPSTAGTSLRPAGTGDPAIPTLLDQGPSVDLADQTIQVPGVVDLDDLQDVLPTRTQSDVEPVLSVPDGAWAALAAPDEPLAEAPSAVPLEAPDLPEVPDDSPASTQGWQETPGEVPVLLVGGPAAVATPPPPPLVLDLESHLPAAHAPDLGEPGDLTDVGAPDDLTDAPAAEDGWDALQPITPTPDGWALPVALLPPDADPGSPDSTDSPDSSAVPGLEPAPSAGFVTAAPEPELRLLEDDDVSEPAAQDDVSSETAAQAEADASAESESESDADADADEQAPPTLSVWPGPPVVLLPGRVVEAPAGAETPEEWPVTPTTTHYSELSRQLARAGRQREAVMAQWAADLHVLAPLLGDRVPELSRALHRVNSSDPAAILGSARAAAVMLTDRASLRDLLPLLDDLDHLTTPPTPVAGQTTVPAVHEIGRPHVAPDHLAALESVLARSAEAGGDDQDVSVALRWDLITHLATGGGGTVSRSSLLQALEPHERDAFDAELASTAR